MKLLTKEEEAAHYKATLFGGTVGGVVGLGVGFVGVALAQRRYPAFRHLTLPLKAFLVTSAGTFTGIIAADHASRRFEVSRNLTDQQYEERQREERDQELASMSWQQRAMDWGRKERYKIVGGSWVASMVLAFGLVGRNPYLTTPQKLVQARVYAQGLTLAVLIATAAFEVSDRRQQESGGGHPEEHGAEDQWKDMVEAEEERLKERDEAIKRQEEKDRKSGKAHRRSKAHHKSEKEAAEKNKQKGDNGDEDEEEDEGPAPVPGKKGEGKMMKKVSDKPDKGAVP